MPADGTPRSLAIPRGTILLLALAGFFSSSALRVCDALLPRLSEEFQRTPGEVSHVVTGFALAYGLMQLVFGPLADRYGKMRLMCHALVGCAVASVIAAVAFNFHALVAARVLWGAAAAGIIPLAMAWIGDAMPYEERQTTLARFMTGTLTGMIAGQLVGGVFADLAAGWRGAFALFTLGYLCIAILLARRAAGITVGNTPQPQTGQGFAGKLATVLGEPWARVVLLAVFVEGLFLLGPLAYIPTLLHDTFGIPLVLAAGLTACNALGGLLYALNAKRIVTRLGERRMVFLGGLFAGVGFLAWMAMPHWVWAAPAAFVLGFGTYLFHNTLQTHATQMAPSVRGSAVSVFAFCLFVGQALGVLLAGSLIDSLGFALPLLLPAVVLPLTGAAFARALRRRTALRRASASAK
ncbi:MFS transporter [Verticiella sediminum]|uniref:MFS transporter n=1 Tax=Verticiella sediminum TaxID=1247510 RepID=A0A556B1X8_9BURK|nr:MFS transporter [Verticiella sediminum]TSH99191.1 MFS transporter [Verticiella sediminum]